MLSNFDDAALKAQLIPGLSSVLLQLLAANEQDGRFSTPGFYSKFFSSHAPGIAVDKYLERIAKYTIQSGECYVLALIYIDRIVSRHPDFVVSSFSIHRLLITSLMVAAKYLDDVYYNNAFYSRVGGVSVAELNVLELEFLFLINFDLAVSNDLFDRYQSELLKRSLMVQQTSFDELLNPSSPVESPTLTSTTPSAEHWQSRKRSRVDAAFFDDEAHGHLTVVN